ncbi:MAG: hypothetical protein ACJAW7_002585 [Candidatus Azotimanducaceae bacterium]|jgi:hypothetical protein
MSWDRTKYEATCDDCDHSGFVIKADDDWGRSQTTWVGFENRAPNPTAVARKQADARDALPLCKCGSSKITKGGLLGSCDSQGNLHENS